MSPKLTDLTAILFSELNKITNPQLTGDALEEQLKRTAAVNKTAAQIVEIGRLGLDAQKALPDMMHGAKIPELLRLDK